MLVLRTGLPGASKTLNSLKEIDEEASSSGRPVYYHNITELQTDKLKASWNHFEDPLLWFELPKNCIIVIDEAQGWFGDRDKRQAMPPHLSEFETHRHKGWDIHLITQHGSMLDVHVRRLAGRHIFYLRLWNGNRVSRYEMDKFVDQDKPAQLKLGRRTIVKIDKAYFGLYKSAVAHNMKFRPPFVVWALPILVLVLIYFGYSYLHKMDERAQIGHSSSDSPTPPSVQRPLASPGRVTDLSSYTPRVEGLPLSAPIYDGLTGPSVAPKLTCFFSDDQDYNSRNPRNLEVLVSNGPSVACGCFTQQGTKVDTPFQICHAYALNGSFDNTPQVISRSSSMGYRK